VYYFGGQLFLTKITHSPAGQWPKYTDQSLPGHTLFMWEIYLSSSLQDLYNKYFLQDRYPYNPTLGYTDVYTIVVKLYLNNFILNILLTNQEKLMTF